MKDADTAVLNAVEQTLMSPDVVKRALDYAVRALEAHRSGDRREALTEKLASVEKAVGRLTNAIAEGGEMEPLVEALKVQDAQRQRLSAELAALEDVPSVEPRELRSQLEGYLADWKGLLRSNVAQGQQALRRLINGRLTFTPRGDYYDFSGVGTAEPMLSDVVQKLVSPTGSEPVLIARGT